MEKEPQNKPLTLKEMPEYIVFKSAFFYCSMIIFLPVIVFFAAKSIIFDGILSLNIVPSNVCSAICSVLVLHVALGLFIYKAYCVSVPEKCAKQD